MAIYQLKTFADIYTAAREELKVQSTDTVAIQRIKRDINITYLDEIIPLDHWQWLRGQVDVLQKKYFNTGTATVTQYSNLVTLSSAPTDSKEGFWFSLKGSLEMYKIEKHTSGSTSVYLESAFTSASASAQTFQIWTEGIPLPSDCQETINVNHDFSTTPLINLGLSQFREHMAAFPKAERRPQYYTTSDYVDPSPYSVISGLPALSTRASAGLIKILTFVSDVSGYLREGDFIEVSAAGSASYNGQFRVASVSSTIVTYVALVPLTESATADVALVLKLKDSENDSGRYRELEVFPALYSTDTLLHVDYLKEVKALESDLDEPLMPLGDRSVLLYGALARAWIRHGDSEEATRNEAKYEKKLAKMQGKLNDSTDVPQLKVSANYMRSKRTSPRLSSLYKWWKF